MERLAPKRMPDGRTMLHIGCGAKTHPAWTNLDASEEAKWRSRPRRLGLAKAFGVLPGEAAEKIEGIDPDAVWWDREPRLPYPDLSFDVVFANGVLQGFDEERGLALLNECRRVLKPRGIVRVAVPDGEAIANAYLGTLAAWDSGDPAAAEKHRLATRTLLEEIAGGKHGVPARGLYNRRVLGAQLKAGGFLEARVERTGNSRIAGWSDFELETTAAGLAPSLCVEALK